MGTVVLSPGGGRAPAVEFDFARELPASLPLVTLDTAVVALAPLRIHDEDQVLALIEDGSLSWAWDIRSPGSERREVRIFWRCLIAWRLQQQAWLGTEDSIYAEVIPTHWQRVRATSIYRRWRCSQELVANLIAARCFTALTDSRRGADGSPEVTRESVIAFLKSRRLGEP